MKIYAIALLAGAVAGSLQSCGDEPNPSSADRNAVLTAYQSTAPTPESEGIAVVELFTSQGCSSCPPADALLKELTERPDEKLAALSFHVDYWNRLGWTDPYSQAAFSERQQRYAGKLNVGVYTPQMIVNGHTAFVGSRKQEALAGIRSALEKTPETGIALVLQPGGEVLNYRLTGRTDRLLLNTALVAGRLENDVPKGENRGRHLAHVNVVQWFKTLRPDADNGTVKLNFPAGLSTAGTRLIVYTQDRDTWEVTGMSMLKNGVAGN